jgi:hypothetical protein
MDIRRYHTAFVPGWLRQPALPAPEFKAGVMAEQLPDCSRDTSTAQRAIALRANRGKKTGQANTLYPMTYMLFMVIFESLGALQEVMG